MKKRLDQIISQLYPQWTRSKIQSMIEKGLVQIFDQNWKTVVKPGVKFDEALLTQETIKITLDEEMQYVSRGALKIKKAFEEYRLNPQNKIALDVGLSTGGFSDYLLKNGALKILGVDVGKDQLHPSLKENNRLVWRDKINAREGIPRDLLDGFFGDLNRRSFDLIVIDVSFISLELILPPIVPLLGADGHLVCLVKPQFELSKNDLNKKGVVKDPAMGTASVEKISGVLVQNKLEILGSCSSPIEGENGNQEYLIVSHRS